MCTTHPNTTPPNAVAPQVYSLLWGYVLLLCAAAMALPVITLPANYHDFADQVAWGVIPHARDVLSNLAFLWAGLWLWYVLRRQQASVRTHHTWYIAALGLALTCVSSGIYHFNPHNAGLAIDRLGMVVAFSGVVGILLADCAPSVRTLPAVAYSMLLGVVGVWADYWHGNMSPWTVYQLGILGLMLLAPIVGKRLYPHTPPRWGIAWWQVMWVYVLAKIAEMADHMLWELSAHIISGHNLKHIIAACAVLPLVRAVMRGKTAKTATI